MEVKLFVLTYDVLRVCSCFQSISFHLWRGMDMSDVFCTQARACMPMCVCMYVGDLIGFELISYQWKSTSALQMENPFC